MKHLRVEFAEFLAKKAKAEPGSKEVVELTNDYQGFALRELLEDECSTFEEVQEWVQDEDNEIVLLAETLSCGELDGSEHQWRVYAALSAVDRLDSVEMLQASVTSRKYKIDDDMDAAYTAVREDVRTAFKTATGLDGGGPDCEGDTVIEFNADGSIDTIDDYWIAATNGSTWEVRFVGFDFIFSLNNDPDD